MDRSELEAGKSLQLLLASAEGLERLSRVECEDGARFGETAAASVAFDEALPAADSSVRRCSLAVGWPIPIARAAAETLR